jgi:[ribosomal protein S18]-alanine N-acetyltransferase
MNGRPVHLRPADLADLPDIHAIERASFGDPWSKPAFAQALEAREVHVAVATDPPAAGPHAERPPVVGFVAVRMAADEAEILNVAVLPAARGAGVGRALLRHALHVAASAGALATFLEVRPSNEAALALYRAFDFVPVGQRRRYYRAPVEDALVLRRGPLVRPTQP